MVERLDGPRAVTSLLSRRSSLADPQQQLARLDASGAPEFRDLAGPLRRGRLGILQLNLGKLCNMSCRHCHVDAGPDRVAENMDRATAEACVEALDRTEVHTVDLTGGAPELNPHFRWLVEQARARGVHVIDRCNLTVLLLPRFADLPGWLADQGVEIVASLPHHRRLNTDRQRGDGTFERSVQALRLLNQAGYGQGDPLRRLTLMHNPAGQFLPGPQAALEREYREGLATLGLSFDRLITLNNMPISRYLEWLDEREQLQDYMRVLTEAFNPAAIEGLMCRDTVSVGWDGRLYDCDFNQMLALPVESGLHIRELGRRPLGELGEIVTRRHCLGCTAGAGSSCGGATAG